MNQNGFKRKLAAIFSTDAKGYSRLMGDDEAATVRTITEYRALISALIGRHGGRVVDSPGDNLLAEFASVVNAVQCAMDIQKKLKTKNDEQLQNRKMEFRIGINLGDVIEKDDRIYGDGINIAARIEGLADGGGICISRSVYNQVKNKLALTYEYLGEHRVKNIKEPVSVYRIKTGTDAGDSTVIDEVRAFDRPSIAILPFVNLSGDPAQGYLSDGLTAEIITGLSNIPQLSVIAKTSAVNHKNNPVNVRQIGRGSGARYLLEGSVQKAGDRVRISAKLIDTKTGQHRWAERYDRDLNDVFALQDEITLKIMAALQVKLTHGEQAHTFIRGTENLEAYEKILEGFEYFFQFNKDGNIMARKIAEEIITLDPDYPKGYVLSAFTHLRDVMFGWSQSPGQSVTRARELADKARAMDDTSATTHALLGNIYLVEEHYDQAISELEKALTLNPYRADNIGLLGMVLAYAGKLKKAIAMFKKAMTLNPVPPDWYYHQLAGVYAATGRFDEAIAAYRESLQRNPDNIPAHSGLAAIYGSSGREKEAGEEAQEALRLDPNFTCRQWAKTLPLGDQETKQLLIDGLHKAGLP
jgi:adenylate cyclase